MARQEQFLDVIDRDEAERRFRGALRMAPLGMEVVPLAQAWGRVLAEDVVARVDVPSFDRANVDGFAVMASDTFGAREDSPKTLRLSAETLATGVTPRVEVNSGFATPIATGAMTPRGADAIVMVEHTDMRDVSVMITRPVSAGASISFAGTDVALGELALRRGELLGSRETGVLAALGEATVKVWRKPKVAILSTGDEIIPPGEVMRPGLVYDSNAQILADAVRELGAEPVLLGIVRDDLDKLRLAVHKGLEIADAVLLSGGTSKGEGDLSYHVVHEFDDPGIVAHGVALKPGKPICLAVTQGKPLVVLPGFPTSAIFTFHEFVAPVLRTFGGRAAEARRTRAARLAVKVNSEIGRTEYLLVGLVNAEEGLAAYPMGKGSGSVTAFSRADGFITIGRHQEILESGANVEVELLGAMDRASDLVAIGSHCVGLDYLLGQLQDAGFSTKFLAVGSMAGLAALERGECDVAGVHLLDAATDEYNTPFLKPGMELIEGYGRRQGIVFRSGDARFEGAAFEALAQTLRTDGSLRMVNRNQGSGTRILIDQLLQGVQPPGYPVAAKNHNAVAAAVAQGRADWGVAIDWVAKRAGLSFRELAFEQYDFAVSSKGRSKPAIVALGELLRREDVRARLREFGFRLPGEA